MYKNKQLRIPVLCAGKTNIRGAIEQIQKEKSPKHFIIRVGCNDLSNENPEDVALKLKINGIGKTQKIHLTYFTQIRKMWRQSLEPNNFSDQQEARKYIWRIIKINKISSESPKTTQGTVYILVTSEVTKCSC